MPTALTLTNWTVDPVGDSVQANCRDGLGALDRIILRRSTELPGDFTADDLCRALERAKAGDSTVKLAAVSEPAAKALDEILARERLTPGAIEKAAEDILALRVRFETAILTLEAEHVETVRLIAETAAEQAAEQQAINDARDAKAAAEKAERERVEAEQVAASKIAAAAAEVEEKAKAQRELKALIAAQVAEVLQQTKE